MKTDAMKNGNGEKCECSVYKKNETKWLIDMLLGL
jgi:hypothetical protein